MKALARAALGLALLGGVAAQAPVVSAQGGGELAQLCQDPVTREAIRASLGIGARLITLDTTGECVSLVQTRLANDTESARFITLLCQGPVFGSRFSNQGECIAALNAAYR